MYSFRGSKVVLIMSSMDRERTADFFKCDIAKIVEDAICGPIRMPDHYAEQSAYVVIASPITRFLAYSMYKSCDSIKLLYDKSDPISMIRAKEWFKRK